MTVIATLTMNPALDVTTATGMVRPTHKLRCAAPRFDPGGGGINAARVINALGGDTVAIFPSGGPSGARIARLLEGARVPHQAIAIAGDTRESLTVDEQSTGNQYRFVLPGPTLSEREQSDCLETVMGLAPRPGWLVASGSLPPGVPDSFYMMLGGLCRSLRIRLVLDSSGPALAACAGLHAALIKPSLSELEALAGKPLVTESEQAAAAHTLVERGFADAVLVSLGANGALLVTDDLHQRFAGIAVPVKSTVGAGDSMVGATALGLARGMALTEAVRLGIAAGAAALMVPGTGLARLEDVQRLFKLDGQAAATPIQAQPVA